MRSQERIHRCNAAVVFCGEGPLVADKEMARVAAGNGGIGFEWKFRAQILSLVPGRHALLRQKYDTFALGVTKR